MLRSSALRLCPRERAFHVRPRGRGRPWLPVAPASMRRVRAVSGPRNARRKSYQKGRGKDLQRLRKVLSPHTSDLQNAGTERPCVFLVHHHVIRSSGFAEFLLHGDAMCWVSLAIALSSDVKNLRDSFASVRKESNLSKAFSSPDSPACLIHE